MDADLHGQLRGLGGCLKRIWGDYRAQRSDWNGGGARKSEKSRETSGLQSDIKHWLGLI